MAIRVALHHRTRYEFDRPVKLSPHEVRLKPAAHARTPILSYSLTVDTEKHFINWQQDPYGNYIARYVFPEMVRTLDFTVDLVADMTVINPFDFFVEKYAEHYPFQYTEQQAFELTAYLQPEPLGPQLTAWMDAMRQAVIRPDIGIVDFLVAVNQRLQTTIGYTVRMEPGIQTPEDTLTKCTGSCRDSAWLLVQIMRNLGLAARFVSGYLIQLKADVAALDGPSGTDKDFTDLHAWAEVFIPGAGWVGLDPTSGLMAGEGHIPLACTALPSSAAPVVGFSDVAEVVFSHEMTVTRIHEDPRVTQPYSEADWQSMLTLGDKVDRQLVAMDVRLTQGGEPTFVSIDDMEAAQWNTEALGAHKRQLAGGLALRLKTLFAARGFLHYGQGKWYPGEPLPRWAINMYWRPDGKPLWHDASLFSSEEAAEGYGAEQAAAFTRHLADMLGFPDACVIPAYEDVWSLSQQEQGLPDNLDPLAMDLRLGAERKRLADLLCQGLGNMAGYVLPLKPDETQAAGQWLTSRWPLRREHLYLLAGDSPMGLRLPLASLPWQLPAEMEPAFPLDPFAPRQTLAPSKRPQVRLKHKTKQPTAREVVHTALCVQVREGRLHVFMPPVSRLEDYLDLLNAVEQTASDLQLKLWLEGYTPPRDSRLRLLSVTPDPGVIEVNIHPAASWKELVANVSSLYDMARLCRLGTEKFMLDGRHTGTGGGNHVTLGGATAADSPLLRRPDVLRSLITYWQNHPALSYLFSGTFIGPTSQAPRVDEARDDNLYELEIAFQQMAHLLPAGKESQQPWLVDRLLRNLLVDLTGNTHRSEFSIDKLYSPDGPTGRLGLVEFRAFEMPPHARMSLLQSLLLRALVARFWKTPYTGKLVHWGTELHDRWMLPQFVAQDMADVVADLRAAGYAFESRWFEPFVEFRFPRYGTVAYQGVELELRQAIEPWNVLGEEMSGGGTARYVDSSVERMQLRVRGLTDGRHVVTCNGRPLPLQPTGQAGEYVAGVRFRAWSPWSALHPSIPVQAPLVFDLVDTWSQKSLGGCTYHVSHPGGRNYSTFPVNANEAEARRVARFWAHGHTPGKLVVEKATPNPRFPFTLDLRWQAH
ncbi:MAG TPA: transglutaminase family protein [Methylophilus sp.]